MSDTHHERLLQRVVEHVESRFYGKYLGFLVDNQDPQRRGRLRLRVPEVLGEVVSGWAEPCLPYGGGPNFGAYQIPPVTRDADGDYATGIWVEFIAGNPQFPLWTGCCFGAPGGRSEAPGDADSDDPNPGVHVHRSFAGHTTVIDDSPGRERLELRDAAGQRLTFSAPLRDGVKRDEHGQPTKGSVDVDYGDLVGRPPTIELADFAGNSVRLDGDRAAPALKLTNTDRDGQLLQTIELYGAAEDPKIVIRDNNENVVTLDRNGIRIEAPRQSSTIVMGSAGIAVDSPRINLNSGSQGVARHEDAVASTVAEDPNFWTFIPTLMGWLASHTHGTAVGPSTPPVMPFPGSVPDKCVGKIIEASQTVSAGG